jgi:PAS domain-containing protein
MDFPHYLIFSSEVLGAVTAIFGTLLAIYRFGVAPIIRHLKDLKGQFVKLDLIFKELQPNSGASLKDAVNQIRNTVHTIEKRQRAWLSYEDQGIFETDDVGRLIWCNRAYLRMLNATFEQVSGNGWKNFIHPDNKELVFKEWTAAIIDKRDCKGNLLYLTADNEKVCATCESFAIKDDSGVLTGYVGVITVHEGLDKCKSPYLVT